MRSEMKKFNNSLMAGRPMNSASAVYRRLIIVFVLWHRLCATDCATHALQAKESALATANEQEFGE